MTLPTSKVCRSTVGLAIVFAALHFTLGCANQRSAEATNEFKIEFGQILTVDGLLQLGDRSTTIEWIPGVHEPRIGAYVENLSKNRYSLAYVIGRVNDDNSSFKELERDGWWTIGRGNDGYEAFIFSDEIRYSPGLYVFYVLVDGKEAKRFGFTIVNGGTETED